MGRCVRTGFVWVRHVNNSRNFDPRRPGDTCKAQLAELSKELLWIYSHLGDKWLLIIGRALHKWLLLPKKHQKNRRRLVRPTCHFAPRPSLWLKTPKLTLLRKMPKIKRSDGPRNGSAPVGQRDHETCATLVKPWWNLGETLAESSAEPFSSPRRICPREPKTPWNLKNFGGGPRRVCPREP